MKYKYAPSERMLGYMDLVSSGMVAVHKYPARQVEAPQPRHVPFGRSVEGDGASDLCR
jgi:hypothetical protein